MANICDNTFFASSENRENIDFILKFLEDNFEYVDYDYSDDAIDAYFEYKWSFPEELMEELYNKIPDKSDIYMRCLSVEYGLLYHALWVCDENGWQEV